MPRYGRGLAGLLLSARGQRATASKRLAGMKRWRERPLRVECRGSPVASPYRRAWWAADFQVHVLRWNKKDLSTAVSAGVVCEGAADLVKQVLGFHNSPGQSGADILEHLSHGVVKLWPTDGMNPAT